MTEQTNRTKSFTYLITIILGLAGALFLNSCQKEEDLPAEILPATCIDQSKINTQMACYEVYAPVCGCDGVTYSNDCYAESAGVLHFTEGECQKQIAPTY